MDICYSDFHSRNFAFHCFMFNPEISNRMVFVNGKHPLSSSLGSSLGWGNCIEFLRKTLSLFSYCLHQGALMSTDKFNAGGLGGRGQLSDGQAPQPGVSGNIPSCFMLATLG